MRVLLVNTSQHTGGAAIAAHRLMEALNNNGVKARMLVRDGGEADIDVAQLPRSPLLKAKFLWERLEIWAANGFRREGIFAVDTASCGTDITRLPEFQWADVIHLHWVNQGFLSLADIGRILASGKPVVWTMHDMWPLTGICHQAHGCERWLSGCGRCPKLHGRPSRADLSARTFRRKQAVLAGRRLTFVGCSRWLTELALRAPLLQGQRVVSIPNPINTDLYAPASKAEARRRLGLPADRKIILFVAYKATDPNKGFDYLRQAVERLCSERPERVRELAVAIVGREADTLKDTLGIPIYTREYVTDAHTMVDFYNAADVLAMPTQADNLPNTVVEAMACATPCAAFAVGGLTQMIDPPTNGLLAAERDVDALGRALSGVLDQPAQTYEAMCNAARHKVVETYSARRVAARYAELYAGL